MSVSPAFALFLKEAPEHAQAWMQAAQALDQASALDKKTEELAYLAVLAATGTTPLACLSIRWRPNRTGPVGKK